MPGTPDSNSSQVPFSNTNAFQRRNIGSLRNNKKLSKILQQFEKAAVEDEKISKKTKYYTGSDSAPCSMKGRACFEHFPSFDSSSLKKKNAHAIPVQDASFFSPRRHSEGETIKQSLLVDSALKVKNIKAKYQQNWEANTLNDLKKCKIVNNDVINTKTANHDNQEVLKQALSSDKLCNAAVDAGVLVQTNKPFVPTNRHFDVAGLQNSIVSNHISNDLKDTNPPPIPRRGLSLPISDIMQDNNTPVSSKTSTPNASPHQSLIKQDSVRRAIQMYEGLSTKGTKTRNRRSGNYSHINLRKDQISEPNSKRGLLRKSSSKRNSFRSNRNTPESKKHSDSFALNNHNDNTGGFKHSKEDSGIGFSDSEDLKSPQGIYQSLCCVKSPTSQCDTYDRLNRIHDMVNRIHKGQSSSCAACKAIPISTMQFSQADNISVFQVKCNELSPHHHPPCICFSCQHSVFSCSQSDDSNTLDVPLDQLTLTDQEENLYYNVCCLTKPNCEGWRRSRRRPVCEQNGRLCVVNCDMEKKLENDFYEKIFEWNTKRLPQHHHLKHLSGDSCDSDEGWVDITDSEDEKLSTHISTHRSNSINTENVLNSLTNKVCNDSTLTKDDGNSENAEISCSKINTESISRAESSEHLYETIGDIENNNNKPGISTDGKVIDNEPDSGEWSTESSSSPTPVEPECNHHKAEAKTSNSSISKFALASDLEYQDSGAKKTFIKTVLGRKTVTPKKRRMSHFFVPWLVANQEYTSARSPKSTVKKNSGKKVVGNSAKSVKTFSKNQRSQSIPLCSLEKPLSVAKIFSSAEILDRCDSDSKELDQIVGSYADKFELSAESLDSLSQRGSLASSSYIDADQLQSIPRTSQPSSFHDTSSATEVSVERIFRKSMSRDSVHSYIVFRPIKEDEVPLYQFYERNIKERVAHCRSPECLSPVMWSSFESNSFSHDCPKTPSMKSQLSVVEQLSPDTKDLKMLWCELPEVKDSGILARISAQELKLQEAAFEFIQSQASFVRSLKVLSEHFIRIPEFSDVQSSFCVLSKHEHDVLFSDIIVVKEVSERLMAELTARWSDGVLIPDICDIIYRQAVLPSFYIYAKYCSNRVYQEKTLKELKETRLCFLEVLRKLESNPACQGLSLESFLFLPIQHIARLPLLLDNIFRWLGPDSPSFNICKLALEAVHKIFMECNDRARKMERLEEMFILNKQLEFKECKVVPLISASRWLLKKGELVKLEFDKKTFGRSNRCLRVPVYIFLFNDLLVVTKRKSDDSYSVLDYCPRDKVQAMPVDAKDLQQPDLVPSSCRYLVYLTLFSNHQGNAVDFILNCTLQSERTRWIEAIQPIPQGLVAVVWEDDSPQVQCVRSYIAQQPDELSLQESDVVTIQRKMNDGWYEGRRLRDGLHGWFPASYTMDIPCSRARASNLRQCYRLLMLSQKHETNQ